jgi:hypothetical protein
MPSPDTTRFVQPDPFDPDVKWIVRHSRMTDTLTFGPFDSHEEAVAWCERNGVSPHAPQPMLPPSVEAGGYHAVWAGWRR